MQPTIRLYLILITSMLFSARLAAQAPYNFFHLFLDKGLSDARVTDIVQDRYGFMWFATPNGLNRYDGYSIKTFYAGQQSNGLPSNVIHCLYPTRKGELWIGTAEGPVLFDFIKEQFIRIDTLQPEAAELGRSATFAFEEDAEGNLYVGSVKGLYRYRNKRWENLTRYFKQENRMRCIRGLKFFNKDLLFVTNNENLPFFRINITTNTIDSIRYKTPFADTCCPIMYGMEKLNDSILLAGYLSAGMARLNVNTNQYSMIPGVLGKNDSIAYNSVYDIIKDHRGRIWIASYYFRLVEYLPAENRMVSYAKDPSHPYGFDGNSAICVYEDRQHNIWVGTTTKGVYRFNPDHATARFYSQNDDVLGAQQRGRVSAITVIDPNTLLIGSDRGPSFYNRSANRYTNYKGVSNYGINAALEMVQCGIVDKTGIVWMGTNRLGLMRYDRRKQTFQCFSRRSKPYPLVNDGITDIVELPDTNLLFIGYGRLNIFNTRNYSVNELALSDIRDICTDQRQHVWLLNTTGNLYEYDPYSKKLTDRTSLLPRFQAPTIIHSMAWHRNELYLAASTGIIRIGADKAIKLFPIKPGVHIQNDVRGILPDGDYLWFCNNYLIGRMHIPSGDMIFLGEKDGLSKVQLFPQTLTRSPQGTILMGSNKGFYEIWPDRLQPPVSAAPHLTAFRVYDKPFLTNDVISDVREIQLNNKQNFFSFDMSAFDYAQAGDIEYAYMLQGFDKDWQYTGRERRGSYTNVPGGNYVLKLRARNLSGNWIESTQQVKIHIQKPFTATWIFRLLVLAAVITAAWVFYRYRIDRINKEARLRSDYEIKLNELENSALRTQMNPHFIFNSLNTINSFVNSNDRVQANQYISKFSRLVRLILDHSRQKKITLRDELEVAELYMQLEQIRFERCFRFTIDVQEIDPAGVEVPPLIIQPFVENSILHGLLPLKEEGLLNIRIYKEEALLQIVIEDNGIGRKAASELKNQSGFKRRSHGMEITLKRIELFNKENGLQANVQISDRAPAGTKVEIPLAYSETF